MHLLWRRIGVAALAALSLPLVANACASSEHGLQAESGSGPVAANSKIAGWSRPLLCSTVHRQVGELGRMPDIVAPGECRVTDLGDARYEIDGEFTVVGYAKPVHYTAIAKVSPLRVQRGTDGNAFYSGLAPALTGIRFHGFSDDFIPVERLKRTSDTPRCAEMRDRLEQGLPRGNSLCYPGHSQRPDEGSRAER